jgi:hypothetical protein
MERGVIRVMVLAAVLLVLAQMGLGLAKDPVDFYIAMAQKVEAPSMDIAPVSGVTTTEMPQENLTGKTWKLTLKASPAAPVRVLQNGRLLGTLTRGELEIPVQTGNLQLDGTNSSQIVRVQVIKKDTQLHDPRLNQSYMIEHNVQTIRVAP